MKRIDSDSLCFHARTCMGATLTIADLDEGIEEKLRAQASSHGRSVEAEARELLTRAVNNAGDLASVAVPPSADRQPFLDLAGSVDGTPDLSRKRGFEA